MEAEITHIALVLFIAFVSGMVLERFKLPTLIGYIIAGMVIGPSLLGIHAQTETIRTLAEFSVLLLMFMLGLELDVHEFKRYARRSFFVAGLQVLSGVGVMLIIGAFTGWSLPLSILLGLVVSLSSTAVAVSVMRHLGTLNTETGKIAVGILIAEDILLAPMLLVVSALGSGDITAMGLVRTALALTLVIVSLFIIFEIHRHPKIIERIERVLTNGATQPVLAGMVLCFGAAAVSGMLGLSAAYGAFAMGLLVGNIGEVGKEYRWAVTSIHDLLLMIFFLSVGLMLDPVFMYDNWKPILGALSAVVVLKTLGNFLLLRITGVSSRDALGLGAVLGQIGEFAFVLIGVGLTSGFIAVEEYQLALVVIALSLLLSPIWFGVVRTYLEKYH